MIVVDASIVTEALHGRFPASVQVLRRIDDEPSFAPHLVDPEVLSALRKLERRGELTDSQARTAMRYLPMLPITRVAHSDLLDRCWELRQNLTPYDAAYAALAEQLEATLLTADGGLARAPGLQCRVELLAESGRFEMPAAQQPEPPPLSNGRDGS